MAVVTSKQDVRTVHAVMSDGSVLCRYDRAGKWYQEWPPAMMIHRQHLTLTEVVREATDASEVRYELPGGGSFDKRVRDARGE